MKIEVKELPPPPPAFTPVQLTVTLNTQAEVDALFAVGNWNMALAAKLVEVHNPIYQRHTLTQEQVSGVLEPFYNALSIRRGR